MLDSLTEDTQVLTDLWSRLLIASHDREHPFQRPQVGVAGLDDEPTVRTVVLRSVDIVERSLCFYSDVRAAKIAMLRRRPRVTWCFWDTAAKLQIRLGSAATIHTDDALADESWATVPRGGRVAYQSDPAPGTPIADVYRNPPTPADQGRSNFAVVRCVVDRIDWLFLHEDGHRRMMFTLRDSAFRGEWVAP